MILINIQVQKKKINYIVLENEPENLETINDKDSIDKFKVHKNAFIKKIFKEILFLEV